jgi:hypothetical protein
MNALSHYSFGFQVVPYEGHETVAVSAEIDTVRVLVTDLCQKMVQRAHRTRDNVYSFHFLGSEWKLIVNLKRIAWRCTGYEYNDLF